MKKFFKNILKGLKWTGSKLLFIIFVTPAVIITFSGMIWGLIVGFFRYGMQIWEDQKVFPQFKPKKDKYGIEILEVEDE